MSAPVIVLSVTKSTSFTFVRRTKKRLNHKLSRDSVSHLSPGFAIQTTSHNEYSRDRRIVMKAESLGGCSRPFASYNE
jgi:hypothetical protein